MDRATFRAPSGRPFRWWTARLATAADLAVAAAALAGVVACAAPAESRSMRILVTLVAPASDGAAIARDAAAAAGVPVRYLAAISATQHALSVDCVGPAGCELALARLRADSASFNEVQSDERRPRH